MTELHEYESRTYSYDSDMFIGRLAYYAIPQTCNVPHNEFCAALIEHQLTATLPPVPRPRDLFKRCCTAAQRRRVHTPDPEVFINYNIREVGKDSLNVWRTLVAETVDTSDHNLGYQELVEFNFYQPDSGIHVKPLVEMTPDTQAIVDDVLNSFAEQNNMLTPYHVREFVRRSLRGLHATAIRDGVYFVGESHSAMVIALEEVINALPGAVMHSLPLLDDRKQRAMLKKAFEDESVNEIDRMLGEIREILQAGKLISSNQFAEFKTELDMLRLKAASYEELLSDSMGATESRLQLMDEAVFRLIGQVKP